ncbi:MAG: MFS transporter [Candidatus Aminicenantes bacterium]|nr:MFS transporter [Candidatus Aminicenantes bacterium]
MTPAEKAEGRSRYWRIRIFLVTWLAYAGFYLTRKSFSVAKIGMAEDPAILLTKAQMTSIDAAYLASYAAGQFLWGILGDRKGARKLVLMGLLGSILAAVAMGLSSLVILFGVFFSLQGLFQSTGWAPLAKNISAWFSRQERGVVMGWWSTNYIVGGIIASPLAGYCADVFTSWRFGFFGPAAALFAVWALFVLFQKDRPSDVGLPDIEPLRPPPDPPEAGRHPRGSSWTEIAAVFRNRVVLRLAGVYFLLKPTRYAILFWGPLYIHETLGTGMAESGALSVAFEVGGPLGVLAGGYVSDRFFGSRRMPVSVVSLFLLGLVLLLFGRLASAPSPLLIAGLLFAVGFLLYLPDSLVSGTAAVDFGGPRGASTASGFINGCGSAGAILGGSLPGLAAKAWGWGPLFAVLGASVLAAGLLLLPKWNALPTDEAAG